MNIEWTKEFPVSHERGAFKILISKHGDSNHYASLLHYEKRTAFNVMAKEGLMRFALHTEFGASEQEALDNLRAWVSRELPGKCVIGEVPKMREISQTVALGN